MPSDKLRMVALAPLLLALPAVAAPAAEPAAGRERLDVTTLAATGEPRRCLSLATVGNTTPAGDSALMVRTGANRWYRNDLRSPCPAMRRDRTIVHRNSTGMLCEMDWFRVVDPVSRMDLGTCMLGRFTPVDLPRGARF